VTLAAAGGPPAEVLIDSTHMKAHRSAAGGKGGLSSRRSASAGRPDEQAPRAHRRRRTTAPLPPDALQLLSTHCRRVPSCLPTKLMTATPSVGLPIVAIDTARTSWFLGRKARRDDPELVASCWNYTLTAGRGNRIVSSQFEP
jgi:hypothetical protein